MPTTAQQLSHLTHINSTDRTQRHRPGRRTQLLQHSRHLRLLRSADEVDNTLHLFRPQPLGVLQRHHGVHQPKTIGSLPIQHSTPKNGSKHVQVPERVTIHQRPRHSLSVHTSIDQPSSHPMGIRAGMAKRTRISNEPRVDTTSNRLIDLHTKNVQQPQHHQGRRLSPIIHDVHGAKTRVRHVVVQHHDLPTSLDGGGNPIPQRPKPPNTAGVQRHQHRRHSRNLTSRHQQPSDVQPPQSLRHLSRRPEGHPHHHTTTMQGQPERQRTTQRISVGVHVGKQRDIGSGSENGSSSGQLSSQVLGHCDTLTPPTRSALQKTVQAVTSTQHTKSHHQPTSPPGEG